MGLTKTSASLWIFDLEFFKKYFCNRTTANMPYPLIFDVSKKAKN
jgi:hypothetical protein